MIVNSALDRVGGKGSGYMRHRKQVLGSRSLYKANGPEKGSRMRERKAESKAPPSLKSFFWVVVIFWTAAIVGLLIWGIHRVREETEMLALHVAETHFDKEKAFRLWVASKGGVYVPAWGNVWVESDPDRGSRFHFTVFFELQPRLSEVAAPDQAINLEGVPVPVVDDNLTNRRILEKTLLYWKMKPTVVASAFEAMEELQKAHRKGTSFRLMLTDCMMPEMDGFELIETVNQYPEISTPTIILLTSAGERGDASRCQNLGVAAYLLKPVSQHVLLLTIAKVLHIPSGPREKKSLVTRHSIRESKKRAERFST